MTSIIRYKDLLITTNTKVVVDQNHQHRVPISQTSVNTNKII
jgi:hypothetical protein